MARKKTENYAKDPAVIEQASGEGWISYNGDSCVVLPQLPDKSIDLSVFSPPFRSLYTYSDTPRDIGNCATLEEFMEHFQFIVCELLRLTKPGRNVCVHIQDVVTTVSSNGVRGIEDFTGPVAQLFQKVGFAYCGKIAICKNPQMQAARNKVHELMFATKNRDSCALVPVMIEYIQVFKAPGQNQVPVASQIDNETWIDWAHGIWPDDGRPRLSSKAEMRRNAHPYVDEWIPAVLPFYDIRETDVLNAAVAKDSLDERHMCLAQGSLVLTKSDGYIPIEDVEIGDLVLTHKGRWMPVTGKQCNGVKPVLKVCGQGVANLRLTPEHKLWIRDGNGDHSKQHAKKSSPAWMDAEKSLGSYLNMKLPPVEDDPLTEKEWWIIGRWLGDGHRGGHRRSGKRGGLGQFLISCSHDESESLIEHLGEYAGHVGNHNRRTATQIALRNLRPEVRDILGRCGKGAAFKRLPSEAFTLNQEKSEALLSGYLSADGHYVAYHDRWVASSVSRALLLGMAMVAQRARNVVASVYAGRDAQEGTIEGRTVQLRQDWIFCFRNSPGRRQSGWIQDDGAWKKVRKMEECGIEKVWDISVMGDASFTAEGCIVENCPLQLGLINRLIKLYTNPGETVLDPFAGIGSTPYEAVRLGRKAVAVELKPSYWKVGVRNIKNAQASTPSLDLFAEEVTA